MLPVVISYIVMLATYLSLSNDKQGMLFAIKLPAHAMEHAEIRRIRSRFHKQMIQIGVDGAIADPLCAVAGMVRFSIDLFFCMVHSLFCRHGHSFPSGFPGDPCFETGQRLVYRSR
ncbi:hypothetical protein CULT_80070 [[Clostridium] ultunense Esp]|nr:hypothetical protein CULT_80070 [[Clostridium] ultunense Esp]